VAPIIPSSRISLAAPNGPKAHRCRRISSGRGSGFDQGPPSLTTVLLVTHDLPTRPHAIIDS